jgi:cytochrome b6-f complex iron-sulfur subunit
MAAREDMHRMTTPTVSRGKAASARTQAADDAATPGAASAVKPINRREFLFYIWGASIAVLLAQSAGAIIWFALPRFREGQFGGVFPIDPGTLPAVGAPPVGNPTGRFWLSNTPDGLLALSMVCTHLGCLYAWVPANDRFECPCHGSKFEADGTYIEGPAPRGLDRFLITVSSPAGSSSTSADGAPVSVAGATTIAVDTGRKIRGTMHT